jgi:hypothetical protein
MGATRSRRFPSFYRPFFGAPVRRCDCPQQRQVSESLAPIWLVRLLSDLGALLREPLEHTCDVFVHIISGLVTGTARLTDGRSRENVDRSQPSFIPSGQLKGRAARSSPVVDRQQTTRRHRRLARASAHRGPIGTQLKAATFGLAAIAASDRPAQAAPTRHVGGLSPQLKAPILKEISPELLTLAAHF